MKHAYLDNSSIYINEWVLTNVMTENNHDWNTRQLFINVLASLASALHSTQVRNTAERGWAKLENHAKTRYKIIKLYCLAAKKKLDWMESQTEGIGGGQF